MQDFATDFNKAFQLDANPGADPGFPVGRGVNLRFCQNFSKNYEIGNILGHRGMCQERPPP